MFVCAFLCVCLWKGSTNVFHYVCAVQLCCLFLAEKSATTHRVQQDLCSSCIMFNSVTHSLAFLLLFFLMMLLSWHSSNLHWYLQLQKEQLLACQRYKLIFSSFCWALLIPQHAFLSVNHAFPQTIQHDWKQLVRVRVTFDCAPC